MKKRSSGFTIIEILIVIVILGILAGIGYVTFMGLQRNSRNNQKETQMTVISKALEDYYEDNGQYPSCDEMSSSTAGDILGIDQSVFVAPGADEPDNNSFIEGCESFSDDGNYYDEFVYDGEGYCSVEGDEDQPCLEYELQYYEEGDSEGPVEITGDEIMDAEEVARYLDCPDGFIPVPGSQKYGTNSFCVMKYEAKYSNGIAVSQPDINPWASGTRALSQDIANQYAAAACDDCHLVTEPEWMTIAENVLNVEDNWYPCGDTQCVYNGMSYAKVLSYQSGGKADPNGDDGYYGDGAILETNERRTLKLNTGEYIWDINGNLSEFTAGQVVNKQIYQNTSGTFLLDWDEVINLDKNITPNPTPDSIGIDKITNANAASLGLGRVAITSTNSTDQYTTAFIRGGTCVQGSGNNRGLLYLSLNVSPEANGCLIVGFRAAQ